MHTGAAAKNGMVNLSLCEHIKRAETRRVRKTFLPAILSYRQGWMVTERQAMGFELQAQELVLNVQKHLIALMMKANHWSADQGSSTQTQCIILDLL